MSEHESKQNEQSKPTGEDNPDIVVDEDWKSQVEKEKQQLKDKMEQEAGTDSELPPASFPMLVTSLATQAMMALGHVPDPVSGQSSVNKPVARHMIDTLAMLEEKTKGNLSTEESKLLSDSVHQLRMAFVDTADTADDSQSSSGGSQIELP